MPDEPVIWRRLTDGTDVPLRPDELGYETFREALSSDAVLIEHHGEVWHGPAFVHTEHWPPPLPPTLVPRGGIAYEVNPDYAYLTTGQLDLGVITWGPPHWWHPIRRWRWRRHERESTREFVEYTLTLMAQPITEED
jgi:hypothetical protein